MRIRSSHLLLLSGSAFAAAMAFPAAASAQATQPATATPAQDAPAPTQGQDPADAEAQDQAAEPTSADGTPAQDQIVVTGSRIARPNFDTNAPSVAIGSEEIEARGFETLGQAINEQPAFGVPGASPVGAGQAGSFGSGQSFVNFLGLGSQRTLVLVNGRRFVSSNSASIFGPTSAGLQVDLNSINTRLVERVETIAIGGAPIYGSDAIAGTVNIILRHDFQGLELDAQYGIADEGDAPNYRFRGIWGTNFGGGRGNVVVSGEYNKGQGLVYNDRAITRQGLFYGDCRPEDNAGFSQCLFSNRRIPSISESGIPLVGDFISTAPGQEVALGLPAGTNFGVSNGAGQQLAFDAAGNLIPINFGTRVGAVDAFNTDVSGGNGFNITNTSQLLTDTERYNANIILNYNLTDNVRLFAEGWYAHSSAVNLRAQPVYNSALFDAGGTPDGNIIVSLSNPFLTPAQRALIQNSINTNPLSDQNQGVVAVQDYFYLGRANTDLASGQASSKTDVYRAVLGVDGHFGLFGRQWRFELVGNYGRSESSGSEPVLVQQNFQNAVNGCPAGSTNAAIGTISSTCAPLNLFGTGVLSQAARDYVTAIADPSNMNEQWVATASVSGPVLRLPGGDLSVALGVEHRNEKTSFDPGAFYFGGADPNPNVDSDGDGDPANERTQFGRSVPILPVSGQFHTNEVFGEITAELIGPQNDIPLINRLELHGAARYVDHSTAGGDTTWTVEGRWSPIRDIGFRGNFTHAIRAPAITELFNPSSASFGFAVDPCDASERVNGPDPATRQANCAAAGVPANFNSLSNQRSFRQALAGNVSLANEESDAWSVGVVLAPRFIPALRISVDYLDIKLKNAISQLGADSVVANCYDSTDFPNNAFCQNVTRDAQNQLNFVQTSYFNSSQLRYKGILAAVSYRLGTPFLGATSHLGFDLSYQYLDTLTEQADAQSAASTLDGTIGYPHHSAVLNVTYENGPFQLNSSINYTGEVDQFGDEAPNFRQYEHLSDFVTVNAGVAFNVNDRLRFRFIVDNLFNEAPPFPVPAAGGVVTYFPGVLGRFYRVGASVTF